MKKIFLFTMLVFSFSFSTNAFTNETISSESNILQEKQYTQIEASAIPGDVLKNISTKYGGFTIKDAHVSSDGEYKLVLVKDEKTVTAYFSSKGEFIKEA